jgi:hypothetical protein
VELHGRSLTETSVVLQSKVDAVGCGGIMPQVGWAGKRILSGPETGGFGSLDSNKASL